MNLNLTSHMSKAKQSRNWGRRRPYNKTLCFLIVSSFFWRMAAILRLRICSLSSSAIPLPLTTLRKIQIYFNNTLCNVGSVVETKVKCKQKSHVINGNYSTSWRTGVYWTLFYYKIKTCQVQIVTGTPVVTLKLHCYVQGWHNDSLQYRPIPYTDSK